MKYLYLVLACMTVFSARADDETQKRLLHVSGNYEVLKMPDRVVVSISAYGEDKDADASKKEADDQMKAVKSVTDQLKIPAKHVSTSSMQLQPRYTYPSNRDRILEGFETSYNITITLDAIDQLGTLLQSLSKNNISRIDSISYGLQDDTATKNEALAGAMKNARAKAQLLAEAAGVKLGAPVSIQEGQVSIPYPQPKMMMRAMAMDAAVMESAEAPPAGELHVTANVSATYALED
jgi:uncharacterized protein